MIHAFAGGEDAGFSDEAHIEGDMLLLERMTVFGVRLEERCLLLRCDIPDNLAETKERVEQLLRGLGLELAQPQADLGDIAAIQISGIRGGAWDLWGEDQLSANEALKRAVLGDDGMTSTGLGPMSDMAPGMTLEDLLDDLSTDRSNEKRKDP